MRCISVICLFAQYAGTRATAYSLTLLFSPQAIDNVDHFCTGGSAFYVQTHSVYRVVHPFFRVSASLMLNCMLDYLPRYVLLLTCCKK